MQAVRDLGSVRLSFILHLTQQTQISWETVLWNSVLYVQVPSCILPGGSKEGFVGLLEYAEEVLHCGHVVVCMKKDRTDRSECNCIWKAVLALSLIDFVFEHDNEFHWSLSKISFFILSDLLMRTFMFLGFIPLAPGHVLIPSNTDPANLFMLYTIE